MLWVLVLPRCPSLEGERPPKAQPKRQSDNPEGPQTIGIGAIAGSSFMLRRTAAARRGSGPPDGTSAIHGGGLVTSGRRPDGSSVQRLRGKRAAAAAGNRKKGDRRCTSRFNTTLTTGAREQRKPTLPIMFAVAIVGLATEGLPARRMSMAKRRRCTHSPSGTRGIALLWFARPCGFEPSVTHAQ